MLKLAKLIFGGASGGAGGPHDALVDEALDKAVEVSDPRLRALSGYRRKLRDPVACSVEWVLGKVAAFPPPLSMRPDAFGSDPQIRAFFGSSNQIREVYSQSLQVKDFLAGSANKGLEEFYATLRMELGRKRMLTNALRGDQVRRDVLRTAIIFGEHHIPQISATEKGLREDLEERIFSGLAQIALERMSAGRERRSDLEEQRALLRTKVNSLKASGLGMESLSRRASQADADPARVEHELEQVEHKLNKLSVRTTTLEDHLAELASVLSNPGSHLVIEPRTIELTRMGFAPDPQSTQDKVDTVGYMEVQLSDVTFVGALTRYARADLLPQHKLTDTRVL